ncbi:MAG: bifunctional folylpolyglutamate synthase/dihydrofolate synthase [Bacteroidales bacterium]
MNYTETTAFLYTQYADFQTTGKTAYKKSLKNPLQIDKHLREPHHTFPSIHIAGTNGKGSTAHLLAAVLQTAGYKVGLYTSPHLLDFRERIKVNGEMISKHAVVDFATQNKDIFAQIRPSFFEITTAMALQYFAAQKVDFAIIEVGLGGRLDASNIITPILSIITNIGLDHTDILGNTLAKIAYEKAGIIKQNVPVVIGECQVETDQIFEQVAKKRNAGLYFAEKYQHRFAKSNYTIDLLGDYQQKNLCTALTALDILQNQKYCLLSEKILENGLANAARITVLFGRWQILSSAPTIVCDTAHNPHGIKETMLQLANQNCLHKHIVLGVLGDKDVENILALLPKDATYYFTQSSNPRSMPIATLHEKAWAMGLCGQAHATVSKAMLAAQTNASIRDFIYIGGSTFVVADALTYYLKR